MDQLQLFKSCVRQINHVLGTSFKYNSFPLSDVNESYIQERLNPYPRKMRARAMSVTDILYLIERNSTDAASLIVLMEFYAIKSFGEFFIINSKTNVGTDTVQHWTQVWNALSAIFKIPEDLIPYGCMLAGYVDPINERKIPEEHLVRLHEVCTCPVDVVRQIEYARVLVQEFSNLTPIRILYETGSLGGAVYWGVTPEPDVEFYLNGISLADEPLYKEVSNWLKTNISAEEIYDRIRHICNCMPNTAGTDIFSELQRTCSTLQKARM